MLVVEQTTVAGPWARRWLLLGGGVALGFLLGLATAPNLGCNDGSTGCCVVCQDTCACGNSCVPCGPVCTKPKGCACSSAEASLTAAEAGASSGAPAR